MARNAFDIHFIIVFYCFRLEDMNFDRELDYPGQFVPELRLIHSASTKNKNEKVRNF